MAAAGAAGLHRAPGSRAAAMARSQRRLSGRPIPRRGQVKVAIAMGLAHSFASLVSRGGRSLSFPRLTRATSLLLGN